MSVGAILSAIAGAWAKVVTPLLVIALVIFAALVLTGHVSLPSHKSAPARHKRKPYEYLYLDSARVDSYLGQLNEGNVKTQNRTESQTTTAGVELQVDTLGKATASTSDERKNSAVVTQTEADNFYTLLRKLNSEGSLDTVDLESPTLLKQLERLSDGSMVLLTNAFIRIPSYLSAYPALRYASYRVEEGDQVFGLAPLTQLGAAEVALNTQAKAERAAFIKRAGENPRLPLTVTQPGVTIAVPARFANITGDVSLFATRLNVVGKVVFNGPHFGDGASVATYLPALLGASGHFLHDLGVKRRFLTEYKEARRRHNGRRTHALQASLFKSLLGSLSYGRTVEIVPVAIYD